MDLTNFERYAILRQTNGYVHGYLVLKKLRCGHCKILRLTTPLTIYRVGLPGNSAHKSTRKHRFWTKKHRKCPEITQKITPNLFGTLGLNVQCNISLKIAESLEIKRIQGFFIFPKITRICLIFSFLTTCFDYLLKHIFFY